MNLKIKRGIAVILTIVILMSICVSSLATSKAYLWGDAFDLQERYGTKNTEAQVKAIQRFIEQYFYDDHLGNDFVDGGFGPATDEYVKRLQEELGLAVDGRVGKNTWNAMQRWTEDATPEHIYHSYYLKYRYIAGRRIYVTYSENPKYFHLYDSSGRVIATYTYDTRYYYRYFPELLTWYLFNSSGSTLIIN